MLMLQYPPEHELMTYIYCPYVQEENQGMHGVIGLKKVPLN